MEAWVFLPRENRKVRKTFAREAEAKSWRGDALAAANRGALRADSPRRAARSLRRWRVCDGMKDGTIRPKGRPAYKPNTVRSYEPASSAATSPVAARRAKVGDVRRADVQAFADELLAPGSRPAP